VSIPFLRNFGGSMFPERLKEIRSQHGYTQKNVADKLGISERAYQHYELSTRKPDFDGLIKIAEVYNVSIDYLVGRTNNPNINL